MKQGKTESGFSYEFDERRLNDMKLVDMLAKVINVHTPELDRIISLSSVMERLLGVEQKDALYDHIAKQNDDLVPPSVLEKELQEILSGNNTAKN